MSKKHTAHWMRTNGDNVYTDDKFEKVMSIVSKILLDVVCAFLFVLAAKNILFDVYEWAIFDYSSILFMMIVVSTVMELSFHLKKVPGSLLRVAVLIVGSVVIAVSILNEDVLYDIIEGFERIIYLYVEDWNYYYGTDWYVFEEYQYLSSNMRYWNDDIEYIAAAIEAVVLVLTFILLWIAKMIRKNIILIIIPIIALAVELIVGLSPEYGGLMWMFVGAVISNAGPWEKPEFTLVKGRRYISIGSIRFFYWGITIITAVLLSVLVSNIGENSAEKMLDKADEMKQFAEDVADSIENAYLTGSLFGEPDSKTDKLDNSKPDFKYKEMLKITSNVNPLYDVYLKGYYANKYTDGVWSQDTKEFDKYFETTTSDNLAYLAVNKIQNKHNGSSLYEANIGVSIYVDYLENSGTRAYTPYFAENNNEGMHTYGEGLIKKKANVNTTQFPTWKNGFTYISTLATFSDVEKDAWEYDYENYIKNNYLDVPDNLEMPKKIAEEIKSANSAKIKNKITGTILDNNDKIFLAELVARWMQENTYYSFNLPEIPEGVDPIDFFLNEGRKGYCMHYASASVMILREMGVPARYATGYLAKEDAFESGTGMFTAVLKDSDAHAWVEIYLSNIGWVPYEVTKGFNESIIYQIEMETTRPNSGGNVEPTTTKPPKEPATDNETKPEETTKQEEKDTTNTTEISTKSNEFISGTKKETSGFFGGLLKLFIIILAVVILVEIVLGIRKRQEAILHKLISDKKTKRAIKMINRRMYKRLRHRGKILKSDIRDTEFENALIEVYPNVSIGDWKRYMELVKKAAFSNDEMSEEDMKYCYKIYCDTKQKEKNN